MKKTLSKIWKEAPKMQKISLIFSISVLIFNTVVLIWIVQG